MKILQMADHIRYRTMTTEELRETFLVDDLFQAGQINMTYVDLDRTVIGSAVPVGEPLYLPTYDPLKASFFTERRELGILNIGGAGVVTVNDVAFEVKKLDALYVGRGNEKIVFSSIDQARPAEFYLLSYPAHATYPTELILSGKQAKVSLGAAENANLREITKLIHLEGTRSCQLVMGFTQLAQEVYGTRCRHIRSMRRSEVYLYFDLDADQRVIHLMGPGHETRNIVVANKQLSFLRAGRFTRAWEQRITRSAGEWAARTRFTAIGRIGDCRLALRESLACSASNYVDGQRAGCRWRMVGPVIHRLSRFNERSSMRMILASIVTAAFVLPVAGAQMLVADHWTRSQLIEKAKELDAKAQGPDGAASVMLDQYPNHYTMIALRHKDGGVEIHEDVADFFVVVQGQATLMTGGPMEDGKTTSPGEVKGTSQQTATATILHVGDIVHIPATLTHQLLIPKGTTFVYFVIKIKEK